MSIHIIFNTAEICCKIKPGIFVRLFNQRKEQSVWITRTETVQKLEDNQQRTNNMCKRYNIQWNTAVNNAVLHYNKWYVQWVKYEKKMQFRIERINRSARNEFCTETQFNRLSIQPVVKFKFTFCLSIQRGETTNCGRHYNFDKWRISCWTHF